MRIVITFHVVMTFNFTMAFQFFLAFFFVGKNSPCEDVPLMIPLMFSSEVTLCDDVSLW